MLATNAVPITPAIFVILLPRVWVCWAARFAPFSKAAVSSPRLTLSRAITSPSAMLRPFLLRLSLEHRQHRLRVGVPFLCGWRGRRQVVAERLELIDVVQVPGVPADHQCLFAGRLHSSADDQRERARGLPPEGFRLEPRFAPLSPEVFPRWGLATFPSALALSGSAASPARDSASETASPFAMKIAAASLRLIVGCFAFNAP